MSSRDIALGLAMAWAQHRAPRIAPPIVVRLNLPLQHMRVAFGLACAWKKAMVRLRCRGVVYRHPPFPTSCSARSIAGWGFYWPSPQSTPVEIFVG